MFQFFCINKSFKAERMRELAPSAPSFNSFVSTSHSKFYWLYFLFCKSTVSILLYQQVIQSSMNYWIWKIFLEFQFFCINKSFKVVCSFSSQTFSRKGGISPSGSTILLYQQVIQRLCRCFLFVSSNQVSILLYQQVIQSASQLQKNW